MPSEYFYTARQLAEMRLPGCPTSKRGVLALLHRSETRSPENLMSGRVRRHRERGGGYEYHVSILPEAIRVGLAARRVKAPAPDAPRLVSQPRADIIATRDALQRQIDHAEEEFVRLYARLEAFRAARDALSQMLDDD